MTFRHVHISKFQELVRTEIASVVATLSATHASYDGHVLESNQINRIVETMPTSASADDITRIEADIASTRERPGVLLHDWKCENVHPATVDRLVRKADVKLLSATIDVPPPDAGSTGCSAVSVTR